jgi:hypothetical protein
VAVIQHVGSNYRRAWPWVAAGIVYATGAATVAVLDLRATGNPLAFLLIQAAWGRHFDPPLAMEAYFILHPSLSLSGWQFIRMAFLWSVGAALIVWMLRKNRRLWPASSYLLVTLLFVNASNVALGITRFLEEVPTWFAGWAQWGSQRRILPWMMLRNIILFILMTGLWAFGFHFVQS